MTNPKDKMVTVYDDCLYVELWYPRQEPIKSIHVGLMDVRAADDIRIEYDFERDGWKISQAKYFSWEGEDEICDPGWAEVAFVQAWGSEVKTENVDES
jgi:hypothetical protein